MYPVSNRVRAYHGKGKGRHGGGGEHRHDNNDDEDNQHYDTVSSPVDEEAPRRGHRGKGESRRGGDHQEHSQHRNRGYYGKGRYGKGKGKGRHEDSQYDPDYDRGEQPSRKKGGGGTQKMEVPPPLSFASSLVLDDPIKPSTIERLDEECSLCMEKLIYVAVGHCGHHNVCWLCALRLRWLMSDRACPMCKEELGTIVLVNRNQYDPKLSIDELITPKKGRPPMIKDKEKPDVYYGDKRIQKICFMIRQYRCGFCTNWDGDGTTDAEREDKWAFHTLGDLRTHLKKQHSRDFCTICLNEREVFILEQYLYSTYNHGADIDRHCRHGDPDLRPPIEDHPSCQFCNPSGRNDQRFYSADQLKTHMRKNHFTCHLCESMGWRNEYYKDYFALYAHFAAAHYPCEHNECLAKRFVVFKTDDDLKIHEMTEHTNFGVMSRAEKRANLRLDFGTSGGRSRKPGQRDDNPNPETVENYKVKFCKPPRQFYNGPDENTALGQEYAALNAVTSDEEDDQHEASDPKKIKEKYPARRDGHRYDPKWHGDIPEPNLPKIRTASAAIEYGAADEEEEEEDKEPGTVEEEAAASLTDEDDLMERGRRVLTAEAQRIVEEDPEGLGRVNGAAFKNKNAELMKACRKAIGDANLHDLKDAAMSMRKEQTDESLDYFIETAADVFSLADGGMQQGAYLFAAMVLLLPIKGLRDRLVDRMEVYAGDAVLQSAIIAERKARSVSPEPRSSASVATSRASSQPPKVQLPDTPVPIPDGLLAGPHKRPSFIKALMAVLDADLGDVDEAIPPKHYNKLVQSVQQIDGIQTDTLAEMRNQLLAVVGSRKDLSWANADMVIGLRPLAYRLLTPRPTTQATSSNEEEEEEYEYIEPARRREREEAEASSAAQLQKGWDEFVQQARRVLHERFNMLELCYMSTYIHLAAGRLQNRGIERGVDDPYSYQEFPLLPGSKPAIGHSYAQKAQSKRGPEFPSLATAHPAATASSSSSSSRQRGLWATRNPERLADPNAFPELPKIQPKAKTSSQWNAGGKARKDIERMKGLERRYPLLVRPTANGPSKPHEPELPGWTCPHCETHNEPQTDTCVKCGLKMLIKKSGGGGGNGGSGGSKGGKRKKASAADKAMGRF